MTKHKRARKTHIVQFCSQCGKPTSGKICPSCRGWDRQTGGINWMHHCPNCGEWAQGKLCKRCRNIEKAKQRTAHYVCPICGGPKSYSGKQCKSCHMEKLAVWHRSPEGCEEMREHRAAQGRKMRGRKFSAESRQKMSETRQGRIPWNKGKPWSEETKEKIRQGQIRAYLEGKFPKSPTSIELIVRRWLDSEKIVWESEWVIPNSRFRLDLYLPELNAGIECNGDYWHSREDSKRRDLRKRKRCKNAGIPLLVLWEHTIRDGSAQKVLYNWLELLQSNQQEMLMYMTYP